MRRTLYSIGLVALLCGGLASPLAAQDAPPRAESAKGAVIKGKAPVSNEVLKVKLPKPKETKLKNGLTVMVLEDHRLPKVLFQIQIRHGALKDPADYPGLASFTADLMKEGAANLNSLQIAQKLDSMGASFGASASFGTDVTNISIEGLSEHTDGLVSLLSDLLLRPTYPQDEIDKYRERELAALAQLRARPGFLATERMLGSLYPKSAASVTAPTEASLKRIKRDDLVRFHDQYYLPNDAVLAVTGDVAMATIVPKLEKAFAGWKQGKAPEASKLDLKDSDKLKISLVNRPGSVQTNLQLGNLGMTRTDPDHVIASVLNQILGAGASSRLFLELREKRGLTYGAYSSFRMDTYRGPFTANAEVRTDVTADAVKAFFEELNKIRNEAVSSKELEDAKRSLVARFALSLESSASLTARAIEIKRYGLPADYWDKYPEMVQKVTAEDIQRVAKKYLDPTKMQIVAVGDAAKIRDSLKALGEVTEVGMDGAPVAK